MTFEEFIVTIEKGISSGELISSKGKVISKLDMAIQYALGREKEEKGELVKSRSMRCLL